MFQTILYIALIQGLFLLFILFKTKHNYLKSTFWLLVGCISSIILYITVNHKTGLFFKPVNLFFLDESLFITFLFLFTKQYINKATLFNPKNLFFFVPNILYFFVELYEMNFYEEPLIIEVPELILELTFFSYLIYTVYLLIKSNSQKWMLILMVPLAILMNLNIINDFLHWFHLNQIELFNDKDSNNYVLVLSAFLFYMLTIKLVLEPKQLLVINENKYKSSGLNASQIESYKKKLINLMENERAFKDSTLSIQKVSEQLSIPRQYISEILNIHMNTNFQEFINHYRIEAFVELLKDEDYVNYTLFGIASEVGFNSKTTFYAAFKKAKDMTPSEYKKDLLKSV